MIECVVDPGEQDRSYAWALVWTKVLMLSFFPVGLRAVMDVVLEKMANAPRKLDAYFPFRILWLVRVWRK